MLHNKGNWFAQDHTISGKERIRIQISTPVMQSYFLYAEFPNDYDKSGL